MSFAPDELVLGAGAARAVLAPALGGRVLRAQLVAPGGGAVEILHPCHPEGAGLLPWPKGGIYPLIPYSGRIAAAHLHHEDRRVPLAAHPGSPHTLHGTAHQRPWTLEARSADSAQLHYLHTPDAHWPWRFEARQRVVLTPQSLSVELTLRNLDECSMPGGIGLHPYLPWQAGDRVGFRAAHAWDFDDDYLATGVAGAGAAPVSIAADALASSEITLFRSGWEGELWLHQRGVGALRLVSDEGLRHLVVHRPAGAPYVCIEPVSHVADGFNLHRRGVAGTGTCILEPGQSMHGRASILTA